MDFSKKNKVVVLPDAFRRMAARRNSTETQQSGRTPRSWPEVKNGKSSAKRRDPTVGPHPKILTKGQKRKK